VKKYHFLILCLLLSFHFNLGQEPLIRSTILTSAYEEVSLRESPSPTSPVIRQIEFGEQVQRFSEEGQAIADEKVYVKVGTSRGLVGWVEEDFFIKSGFPVVILEDARIYERPQTPSSATLNILEPGQIVIQGRASQGWYYVSTVDKAIMGWISREGPSSSRKVDIDLAQRYNILKQSTDKGKEAQLALLAAEAHEKGSAIARFLPVEDYPVETASESELNKKVKARSIDENLEEEPSSSKESRLVWDAISASYYTETVEKGPAIAVSKAPQFPTPFYAYHKSLPIGTKIKMDLPDQRGFIELVVMDRLERNSPAILALSANCLNAVFGTDNPGDVVISYQKE